jgi:AcrR family transcriptional regulator
MTTRREKLRNNTIDEIKQLARQQMAAEGATGISLRAIARDMGMTVTALYRYFASYDDLITELIVDAFNALADHVDAAQAAQPHDNYPARLWAAMWAYREYARQFPHEFALIYGTPIPNYHAPRERTVPATTRTYLVFGRIVHEAIVAGVLHPSAEHVTIYNAMSEQLKHLPPAIGQLVTSQGLAIVGIGWARMHGIVMLELFGHLQPVIGDVDVLYRHELTTLFATMGIPPPM